MNILEEKECWAIAIKILQPLQYRHRLTGSEPFTAKNAGKATNKIPAGQSSAWQAFSGLP
jgi:hypothetical protein